MYLLLIYFLIPIIPLIVMPRQIKNSADSPYRIVMQAIIGIAAGTVIVFIFASVSGQGLFAQMQELSDAMAKELAKNPMIAETFGIDSASEADRIEFFASVYNSAFELLPASILVMGAVIAYVEYIIISKIMAKKNPQVIRMPKFREFSWPNKAFMGIMAMYLLSWILTEVGVFANDMMYANMNMLFNFAFSIQGVSVILMFFHMKRAPKAVGVVVAILLWMIYLGKLALIMIGMLDLIFNLKSKIKSKNTIR